jgi:hypothetical protein
MRQSKKSIEERLRSEKPMRTAPHGFTERVMSRLPEEPAKSASLREREYNFAFWPRFAVAVALIVILAVFAFEFAKPKFSHLTASTQQPASVAGHSEDQIAAEEISIPVITPEQIQALTVKLDDPLEKELNNVISDTRQAIQFVALNFLPEK